MHRSIGPRRPSRPITGAVVATWLALGVLAAPPAAAQFGPMGGQQPMQGMPQSQKKDKSKEEAARRYRELGPMPAPLSPEIEAARERAQERGVLRSDTARKGLIYELRIEGARKVEPDAVLVHIQSRIDRRPDLKIIQADLRRIYRMGLFSDIVVKTRLGPEDSVVLIYQLVEKPAIGNVRFEGNIDVSDDDIEEVVDLKPYQVLDVPRVRATVAKIQKLYVDKGFFLAEVTYELKPSQGPDDEDDGGANLYDAVRDWLGFNKKPDSTPTDTEGLGEFADVVFKIVEHAKVKVESIDFVGNDSIDGDKLEGSIGTRENHPAGVLTEWGTYKEETAELDLLATEAVYQDEGYLNVAVGRPRVSLSSDKTRLSIRIPVNEGEKYSLRSFEIAGDFIVEDKEELDRLTLEDPERVLFLKSELLERTQIRAGDVFARSTVAKDIMAVADRYRDRGYAYVNINPETIIHDEDNTVDLRLVIQAGPRVKVERIEVLGNTKTQDRVIRREFRVYEGEWYSAAALRLSEQRATALGFFEKVEVTTRQGSAPDRMVVVVAITEKPTGTFQLGAGFSNAESFILTSQISQNNALGRGVTLSASVQWSRLRQIVDVRYADPYAFYIAQEPITFMFSVFNTQRNYIDFLRNSTGADVTLGYPLGRPFRQLTRPLLENAPAALRPYVPDLENFQGFVTANGERVEIQEGNFNVRLLGLSANIPRYTSSVRGSLIFDQRNNRLFPSQGYYLQVSAEIANPYLGSALAPGTEGFLKEAVLDLGIRDGLGPLRPGILKRGGLANNFQRYTANVRAYYSLDDIAPFWKGMILKGNVELGWLVTSDRSLIFENYFVGGFNTIRGYYPRSIGPVERVGGLSPDGALREFRIGGTKQLIANLELEIPIVEQVGIRGVLFFDAANAYGPDENFFYIGNGPTPYLQGLKCDGKPCWDARNPADLPLGVFTAVGVGIRWFSPIGPLRFEWGLPLVRRPPGTYGFREGDDPFQFQFNIGNSF